MAIAYGGSGAVASSGTNGPVSPAIPASSVEGDVILAHCEAIASASPIPAITTPSGWTLVGETTFSNASGKYVRFGVYRRVVPSGGLTAPSFTVGASAVGCHARCTRWTGVDIATPGDATATTSTGTSTTPTAPSITSVTAGAMAAYFLLQNDDWTLSSPTGGATLAYAQTITLGNDCAHAVSYELLGAAGASGTSAVTSSVGGGAPVREEWLAVTAALRPIGLIDKAVSDTLTLVVTDAGAVAAPIAKNVSDTLTLVVTDASAVSVPIAKNVSDTLTLVVTDGAGAIERIIAKSGTDTLTLAVTDNGVRQTVGPTFGTWTSAALALPDDLIAGSRLSWTATVPAGGTVLVETSVDNGATFQVATNLGQVPRLLVGTAVAKSVITRVTLSRAQAEDDTPRVHRMELLVAVDASIDELCPLGVFTLNDTSIDDGPDGLQIEVSGADLSRKVSRNRWDNTYVVPEGSNYAEAIETGIADRLPGAMFNFASTDRTTPRLFFGEQSSNDPWTDFQDMALSIGDTLYFDALGLATLRGEPDPEIDEPVWDLDDTAHPVITHLVRRVTDENTYNKIVVTGEGTSNVVPVRGMAIDDDPASPTYYLGPYGTVTLRVTTPMVTTAEQAQEAAEALLRRFKGATEAVEIECVPMPALEPGDVVTVTRGRSKVEGRFLIDALRIPLGAHETMRIVGRRQRT